MKRLLIILLLVASAGAVRAEVPEYWRVVGVDPGDVLNIREMPSPEAQWVGSIPPNARHVRGFGCVAQPPDGHEWCRVKWEGVVGWVRQKYIRREPVG